MAQINPVIVPQFEGKNSFAFESTDPDSYFTSMYYFDAVHRIVDDLQGMIARGPDSLKSNVWQPSRVLRAIINSGISGRERIELVNDATTFAFGMHAGVPDGDLLGKIGTSLNEHGLKHSYVDQKRDEHTAKSTAPTLSLDSAWRLHAKTNKPLLAIPLCHGGFLAGTQMLLYHQHNSPGTETFVYPIRHSRDKHGDWVPHISRDELNYLREIADSRTVVIFDEDADGGDSVLETARYLHQKLPKNTEILGMVNLDCRTARNTQRQGEWWENHTSVTVRYIASLAATPLKQLFSREPLYL